MPLINNGTVEGLFRLTDVLMLQPFAYHWDGRQLTFSVAVVKSSSTNYRFFTEKTIGLYSGLVNTFFCLRIIDVVIYAPSPEGMRNDYNNEQMDRSRL